MESSTDLAFAKDADFRYMCCSKTLLGLLGLKSEKNIIGKTDFDLFPREIAERFRADDAELIANEKPHIDVTEVIPSPDGTLHYTRTSKYLLRNALGNIAGVYCVGRDITDDKETYAQLKLLAGSIPGGLATFTVKSINEMHLNYYNDGFRHLSGHSAEDFERYSTDPIALVYEADRKLVTTQAEALIREEKPMNCIFRIHEESGSFKWVSFKAAVADRYQDSLTVNCVVMDITEQQEEKERLRVSEELNRLAIEHSGSIITKFDVNSRTLTLPKTFNPIFDVPQILYNMPEEQITLGRISPDTADIYRNIFESIIQGQPAGTATYKQQSTKGWRWLEAHYTTIFSDTHRAVTAVISFSDVTEQLEKEVIYNKWQQSLAERPEGSYTLFRCNLSKGTSFESREGTLLQIKFDPNRNSFDGRTAEYVEQCVYADDREPYLAFMNIDTMLAEYHRGHRSATLEYRETGTDGIPHWRRLSVDLVEYPNSRDVEAYLMFEDIDVQKKAELLTKEHAEIDSLTGILNRSAFITRMEQILKQSKPGKKHALLMFDIDNFKQINDTRGHAAGDRVLMDITKDIGAILRYNDLIGRLGGDEFFVFLKDIPNRETAAAKAKQICALRIAMPGLDAPVTVSIGIAIAPENGSDFDTLYKKVDAALYRQKSRGKNGYLFAEKS